jgi:succinyl-diaminopimelate desuccinylase
MTHSWIISLKLLKEARLRKVIEMRVLVNSILIRLNTTELSSQPAINMDRSMLLSMIDTDKEAHLNFLQKLIQAPSPAPPGDTTEAAKVVQNFLSAHGISTSVIAPQVHMPNIVSSFDGSSTGPRVILNGHIDHFPVADASDWKYPPYSGHIDEDGKYIHGRGVVDMKAGTAASIIAFTYLHKHRAALSGSVGLAVVSDEETGGKYGTRYLLGDECGGKNSPWRGDVMLNAEPAGFSIRFAEKGTLRMTFRIDCIGAHGAYTFLSEGANFIGARLVTALKSIEDLVPNQLPESIKDHVESPEVQSAVDEVMGKGAADVVLKPTVNIGVWNGGLIVNVIPSSATIQADVRLPIGLTKEVVLDHIRSSILPKFPQVTLEVHEAASNPSSFCDPEHPLLKAVQANAERATGKVPLAIPSIGATDTKFYRYVGVPAYIFGVSPQTMAARDERVSIDEFMTVIKTHTGAVWDYLGGK